VLQRRERRRGRRVQPRFRLPQVGVTSLGGLMAVALLALLSAWSGHVLIVAPLGASSLLLFGTPRSPLAQPCNVVVGNTLGGFLAVGLTILLYARTCQNVAVAISNSFAGVAKEGASRASKNFTTQADAVKYGKEQAQKEKAELYVHRRDVTIRERRSYGNDPFPPKDKA
jgi:hypothetical protein